MMRATASRTLGGLASGRVSRATSTPSNGPARTVLFDELLELEVELRLEKGESPTAREYRLRFPDHAGAIDAILGRARHSGRLRLTVSRQAAELLVPGWDAITSAGSRIGLGPERVDDLPEIDGALGRIVGEYLILDRIGSGGMGVVYRALRRGANRIVALKLIKADWWGDSTADTNHEAAVRFQHEARATRSSSTTTSFPSTTSAMPTASSFSRCD